MSQYIDADPGWEIWLVAPGPTEIDPQPIDVRTWSEQFADAVFNDAGLTPDHNDRERLVRMLELAGDRTHPRHIPWVAKWVHLGTLKASAACLSIVAAGGAQEGRAAAQAVRALSREDRIAHNNKMVRGGPRARDAARKQLELLQGRVRRDMASAQEVAARAYARPSLVTTTWRQRLSSWGDRDLAACLTQMAHVVDDFPHSRAVANAAKAAEKAVSRRLTAVATGTLTNVIGSLTNIFPIAPYERLKDHWSADPWGAPW